MKTKLHLATVMAFSSLLSSLAVEPVASPEAAVKAPEFKNLSDLKWDKILPDLGADSPEICLLHVDPKTQATSLVIRTPKAIHVRKHWHTANETHTMIKGTATLACDGKKFELAKGGCPLGPSPSLMWTAHGTSTG